MKTTLLGIGMSVAFIAATGTADAQSNDMPTTDLTIIGTSAGSPPWLIEEAYWKDIDEKTDGKLTATIQSMTQLGIKGPEAFDMARLGTANMVMSSLAYSSGSTVENSAVDLPGITPDLETMREVVDAYAPVLDEIYEERLGLKLLGMWPLAAQVFWMNVPIEGIEDLEGKRIRVSGVSTANLVEQLGGIPTTLPFAEVVPALQRGVIDGAITGTAAGNIAQWTDVTTHLFPLVVGWGMEAQVANLDWWNSLDPKVQDLIMHHIDEMAKIGWQQADVGTNNGIWCTVGDERCDVRVTAPKNLHKTDLTLVEVTPEDVSAVKKAAQESALVTFANRCGSECVAEWNERLSPILNVTLPEPAE